MEQLALQYEATLRLASFVGLLIVFVILERLIPRRQTSQSRAERWSVNLGMTLVNTLLIRVLIPVLPVHAALLASESGWGILALVPLPFWLACLLSFVLLDLVIYWQHRCFHRLSWGWAMHRVHHADTEVDVTTGVRFHPLEILVSLAIKLTAVVLLGAPAVAVMAFEVVLNATSLFNHANIKLPIRLDKALRWVLVTPDMHRIHHSVKHEEMNHNFGFNLPWWDYCFNSYQSEPTGKHQDMLLGLRQYRDVKALNLLKCLKMPFSGARE